MVVKILAFGVAKEIFNTSQLSVDIGGRSAVEDLKQTLELQYPRLASLSSYMVAVNNEYAGNEVVLVGNEEIAIIPPVSGG